MSARHLACGATLLAVVTVTSLTLLAQDLWYRSYKDGVSAYNRGDYRTAEAKFTAALRAKDAPTARGRKVLYYSQIRDEFLPEYYLAVINAKNGNYAEALRLAQAAEKYISASDREYASLASARVASQNALNAAGVNAPDNARGGGPSRAGGAGPSPAPVVGPTPAAQAAARTNFDGLVRQARAALTDGRWSEARTAATSAKALGVDNRQADDLLKSVDVEEFTARVTNRVAARAWPEAAAAVENLSKVDPANPLIATTQKTIASGIAVDEVLRLERTGIGAFYRGDYQGALSALGQARIDVAPAPDRDRIRLYIACSNAALAILEGANGKTRLQRAQELFRQLRPNQDLFAVDRRYISPQILSALQGRS
jgi:tetratricopeptide (TPR) repeat protein